MPRYTEPETSGSASAPPPAMPVVNPPVPLPGTPGFTGPVAPGNIPNPLLGLTGKARWDALVQNERPLYGNAAMWSHDFNQWVLSLKDDPNDPAFNSILAWARSNAKRQEEGTATNVSGAPSHQYARETPPGPAAPSGGSGAPGPTGQSASGPYSVPSPADLKPTGPSKQQSKFEKTVELPSDRAEWRKPTFKGRAIGTDEIYNQQGPQDPFLQGFLTENGVPVGNLSGQMSSDNSRAALQSGKYVYMGTETNSELGVKRDVYMYVDQAQAEGMHVESNVLASYQKALGLTVTGRMDPYLTSKWDEAVQMASRSAQAGDKMSVREWFDILMSSVIAQKNGSGGGGGGGGAKMEEFDYYRAMMQVLGDISGVGNA